MLDAPWLSKCPREDTQIIERPGWRQLLTPSLKEGGLNEISLSQLEAAEADAVIDETLARYRALGLRLRWCVDPRSRPADLGERLRSRGLERVEGWGMYLPLPAELPAVSAVLRAEEVRDEAGLEAYTAVMAAGWGADPAPLAAFNRQLLADPERRCRLVLARWEGQPAGAAAVALAPRSGYLVGGVVLPAFRRRGVYGALVAERLRLLAQEGRVVAVTHAQARSSGPLLGRLGFRTGCRLDFYLQG